MTEQRSKPTGYVVAGVPHAAAIKLAVIDIKPGEVVCTVPFDPRFVGNPETGVVHGGIVTALLDNACGIAVSSRTRQFGQIATLDLRIDYMKPANAGADIYAFAECYKVTRNIAFVRGIAYHDDRSDPIATCAAAFMLGTKSDKGVNLPPKEGG
ncbi:MAG: PaaI family thioesterase [Alphaproteobacteria bacterium]|nr:PaaI family thioesterase [Alphaproteobacteria bacterium]